MNAQLNIRVSGVFAPLTLALLGGCTTLGGHVSGDFACRAPQGSCAPSSVIDAAATNSVVSRAASSVPDTATAPYANGPVRAEPGDLARTSERKLRIVFPAHIDGSGIFHEEAIAWAIAEPADWAARKRTASDPSLRSLGKVISERLKEAPRRVSDETTAPDSDTENTAPSDDKPITLLAPPPALPSTAREAIAGAHAPQLEGFGALPPRGRTPRALPDETLNWPSIDAIDAAHARGPNASIEETGKAQSLPAKRPVPLAPAHLPALVPTPASASLPAQVLTPALAPIAAPAPAAKVKP